MTALSESYSYCRDVARRRARNFYYSFVLLPKEKRASMCAVYAFMRYCDDLSDEPGNEGSHGIERWRRDLDRALNGDRPSHPLWPAFQDTVHRYRIPHEYFHQMIDGVSSDVASPRCFGTFEELYRYCYLVASVVGLTIIHIFGFERAEAPKLAEKCGIAFQLTNIIRDVREDAANGRVYLPAEDLERFAVTVADFERPAPTQAFVELMRFETERARAYYAASRPLIGMVERESRRSLWALIEIYWRLLRRIEARNFDVLSQRVSLPAWEKAGVVVSALVRSPGV